jgi:hypothetical protein
MSTQLVTNNATTTIVATIAPAAVVLSVAPGTGALFPNPGPGQFFWATLTNITGAIEIVKVTARASDSFTIVRGQDSTAAGTWNPGDRIDLRPCAALLNGKLDAADAAITYAPLAGATFTGPISTTASLSIGTTLGVAGDSTFTGTATFNGQVNATALTVTNNGNAFRVFAPNSVTGANIQLQDGQTNTSKFIRCTSNNLQVVNNVYNAVLLSIDDAGNATVTGNASILGSGFITGNLSTGGNITAGGSITASGNITAFSDERLKKDWAPLAGDFVERLAGVLSGTYTRIDTGARQVGVGAGSLRSVMPEAVMGGETLSVAYGNAALVAVIELAREVVRLRSILEPAK